MFARVLVGALLVTTFAQGQEVVTIPTGPDKIQPLQLKEPAPYPGMLYDYDTALRWGNWLKQYQLRLKLDVQAEQQKCQVRVEAADKVLDLHKQAHKASEEDLRKRVLKLEERNIKLSDELRDRPWYETRTFGIVVGVVGSATLFGLSVYALDRTR